LKGPLHRLGEARARSLRQLPGERVGFVVFDTERHGNLSGNLFVLARLLVTLLPRNVGPAGRGPKPMSLNRVLMQDQWSVSQPRGAALGLACLVAGLAVTAAAQVVAIGEVALSGTVETVTADGLTIRDARGGRHEVRVQGKNQRGIALADGRLLAAPVEATVRAEFPAAGLEPGQVVRLRVRLDRSGKTEADVTELTVLDGDGGRQGVTTPEGEPLAGVTKQAAEVEVTATVKTASAKRLVVELPRAKAFNRKTVLAFPLAAAAVARLESDDPARIEPAADVISLTAVRLGSGELVARRLVVENATARRVAEVGDEALERKFQKLPKVPPAEPRLVRSPHFAFVTDLSDREWAVVSFKLERMVSALEKFLGRRLTGVVEGFVAADLATFPPGLIDDDYGIAKISRGEGVCVNSRLGPQRRARLYSCGDHGVIQHECVHGICHLAFGSTGPTWLAEGLAELGNYWKEGDQTVDLPAPVIAYLQNAKPARKLLEIAVPGRVEAGTWQDYAWRWALCHVLANNPNYSNRFVPLAVGLMEEREGVSFESVYGPVAREISFEYDQFLATLGNGYRSDLTAWPWKARFQRLAAGREATVAIKAKAGWQPSTLLVEPGDRLELAAAGTWTIAAAGQPLGPAGEPDGRGRLVATVFADYALTPEIPLGERATLEPPAAGQLFLRCADAWTELADNEGEISVTIRRAP